MGNFRAFSVAGWLVGVALVAVALVGCQQIRRYVCPAMQNEDAVRDAYRTQGRMRRDMAMDRMGLWNDGTEQVFREYDQFMDEREARIRRTR